MTNIHHAAAAIGVSTRTIYNWLRSGAVPVERRAGRTWVDLDALRGHQGWLADARVEREASAVRGARLAAFARTRRRGANGRFA